MPYLNRLEYIIISQWSRTSVCRLAWMNIIISQIKVWSDFTCITRPEVDVIAMFKTSGSDVHGNIFRQKPTLRVAWLVLKYSAFQGGVWFGGWIYLGSMSLWTAAAPVRPVPSTCHCAVVNYFDDVTSRLTGRCTCARKLLSGSSVEHFYKNNKKITLDHQAGHQLWLGTY